MIFLKIFIWIIASALLQMLFAGNAFAWGPGVHIALGFGMLNQIRDITPKIAEIITLFPTEYLYGCLAADFFIGKSRVPKNHDPHNWEASAKFLNEANTEQEMSYAYGYLSHLAADVIAHNFFIPILIESHIAEKRMGHLYWEIKADFYNGPHYVRIAKDVLKMDHNECDYLLKLIGGHNIYRLKAKKHIYTQSVKFSHYFFSSPGSLILRNPFNAKLFGEYSSFMMNLSGRLIKDILNNPETSPCLLYDSIGRNRLGQAKPKSLFKIFNMGHFSKEVVVDNILLEL